MTTKRTAITFLTTAALLTTGYLVGRSALVDFPPLLADSVETYTFEESQAPPIELDPTVTALEDAFETAADAIRTSVVAITSYRTVEMRGRSNAPFEEFDDLFERFFDHRMPNQDQPRDRDTEPAPGRRFEQRGLGSGFVLDRNGHIVTNNHVIAEADDLMVRLSDGLELAATVVGTDPQTDLAVIRVDADQASGRLHPARLGNSDALRVGRWVMAAGNPFALDETVTAGIVSGIGRAGLRITDYEEFIQTDAAINQGNSGGPLINLSGEVVGINTAILSRTGGFAGVGFAIPINLARPVIRALIEDGEVTRGYLGVYIADLDEPMARSFMYPSTDGALIQQVAADGPASSSDLQAGDIIMSYSGTPVTDSAQFRNRISLMPPGTTVTLRVWRIVEDEQTGEPVGRELEIDVVVGRLPQQVAAETPTPSEPATVESLGMELIDVDSAMRRRMNMPDNVDGALVRRVDPTSPAARAGIQPGNIIEAVHDTRVSSAAEAVAELERQDLRAGVRLRIYSSAGSRFVIVRSQ